MMGMRNLGRKLGAAMGTLALAGGAPAAAEVIRTTDNSFVTRHELIVKATPKAAWLALILPSAWWQAAHTWSGDPKNLTLTPRAGGCFCETIPEKDGPDGFTLEGGVEHMRVVQAYPEQALRMVGSLGPLQSEPVTGVLTIAISKVDQGTRIVWEYNVGGPMRYEVPVISKAVDGVMGAQIGALAKLLGVVAMPTVTPPTPVPAPAAAAPAGAASKSVTPASRPAATTSAVTKPSAAAPAPAASASRIAPAATLTAPPKSGAGQGAATTSAKPGTTPAPKPAAKGTSVDDAFGDLQDKPKTQPKA
jgi:hypothetical protein